MAKKKVGKWGNLVMLSILNFFIFGIIKDIFILFSENTPISKGKELGNA
jgi:hypothetical protein